MCSAPIGSIPPPIDVDELGIGIELDISGIGDLAWLAAADGCPDEPHAAATSESAATPAPALKAEPGRERPGDAHMDMGRPPQVPALNGHRHRTAPTTPPIDAAAAALIAHPAKDRGD